MTEVHGSMPVKRLLSMPLFWALLMLMFAAGACEMSMSQWASAFAESGLGVSKTVGDLLGVCMFSLLMGIARFLRSRVNVKTSIFSLMIGCGALCAASYLLAALAPASRACAARLRTVRILGRHSLARRVLDGGRAVSYWRNGYVCRFLPSPAISEARAVPRLSDLSPAATETICRSECCFSVVFPIILIIAAALTARLSRGARRA